jgi:hypothetical protein
MEAALIISQTVNRCQQNRQVLNSVQVVFNETAATTHVMKRRFRARETKVVKLSNLRNESNVKLVYLSYSCINRLQNQWELHVPTLLKISSYAFLPHTLCLWFSYYSHKMWFFP